MSKSLFACVVLILVVAPIGFATTKPAWFLQTIVQDSNVWQCLKVAGHATSIWATKVIFPLLAPYNSTEAFKTVNEGTSENISFDAEISATFTGGDVKTQIQAACGSPYYSSSDVSRVWLTVQNPDLWSQNAVENVQFLQDALNATQIFCGISKYYVGIATSLSDWNAITAGSTLFNTYGLWYKNPDGQAAFDDYKSFGAWTSSSIVAKSFAPPNTLSICGLYPEAVFYACDTSSSYPTSCGIHA